MTATRSQIGSTVAAAGCMEASGAVIGGAYGLSDGAVYAPDTSAYDDRIAGLQANIHAEQQAIRTLKDARPAADPIIAQVQTLISTQTGEISAVEQQKAEAITAVNPHIGEHWAQDGAIGMLTVTLLMAGWAAYRRHTGRGIISEHPNGPS
ncbi:MAG TPA: hypothetical protein VLI54_03120 [Bacillota bacterium]|nr:hypothetical protein [Bacillota bacterium]